MPRMLVRTALVATALGLSLPASLQAQVSGNTRFVQPAQRTTVKSSSSFWTRMWGQPRTTILPISGELPPKPERPLMTPFDLEQNSDVQLLKSRSQNRKPTFTNTPVAKPQVNQALPGLIEPEAPAANPAPAAEFTAEQEFQLQPTGSESPADTAQQSQVFEPEPVRETGDVAMPIEQAPYVETPGQQPRFDRTSMYLDETVPDGVIAAPPMGQPIPMAQPVPQMAMGNGPGTTSSAAPARTSAPGYVSLNAPLYPSPRPGIPVETGATLITNPAFDPHEMLYPHRYRGLYGPFYHKTSRFWVMTPLGIYKQERRVLTGTEVKVNYRGHISPFALFFPPLGR